MVALAGAPPNCLYQVLEGSFGFKSPESTGGTSLHEQYQAASAQLPQPRSSPFSFSVPPPTSSKPCSTSVASSSELEARSKLSPESTRAIGFKPG